MAEDTANSQGSTPALALTGGWPESAPKKSAKKSPPKKSARPSQENTKQERRRRALALVEENRIGPASAALTLEGAAPETADARRSLKKKHPVGRAPAPDAAPPRLTESCPQSPEEVLKALGGFPKGSGGGPSGLRPQAPS